ncbi:unnamed protein product [Dibothriocephalus latus]|uniref:CUB domain-containing protein n=1 Tax=Dibothriocephalus latus TaxID=60516 RepID=A0A3P7LH64_DIBLA|nr:unnamed protein product [Dibothriocephalus latus]
MIAWIGGDTVCQHTIVEATGSFELANPNQLRPNTCQWRILANIGESIELKFTRINLLPQYSDGVCNDEYVEVWDGYYSGSKLLVNCDTTLNGPEGTFTSPGYPTDYQANKQCVWKIQVQKHHGIVLEFEEFKVSVHFSSY